MKDGVYSQLFGEDMIDLMSTTYMLPANFEATIVTVGHDEIARPDLISKTLYGDEMYTDLLCKLNGISNPYELNEDMKLVCPSMQDIERFYVQPAKAWKEKEIGGDISPLYLDGEDMTLGKEAATVPDDSPAVVSRMSDTHPSVYGGEMPIQKVRTKAHKPNESLVGDKRFAIKGTENIVIY